MRHYLYLWQMKDIQWIVVFFFIFVFLNRNKTEYEDDHFIIESSIHVFGGFK